MVRGGRRGRWALRQGCGYNCHGLRKLDQDVVLARFVSAVGRLERVETMRTMARHQIVPLSVSAKTSSATLSSELCNASPA